MSQAEIISRRANELLDAHADEPLRALSAALDDKGSKGPALAMAVVKDNRCGLLRQSARLSFGLERVTPLVMAIIADRIDVVEALLAAGAGEVSDDTMLPPMMLPIHTAARLNNVPAINLLTRAESTMAILPNKSSSLIMVEDKDGYTPIDYAARYGHVAAIKVLLEKGSSVKAKTKYGYTPLHSAAENGHVAAVEALIAAGSSVTVGNNYGHTPLHLAAENGHVSAIDALVAGGSSVSAKSKNGFTPLHMAAWKNHLVAIDALIANGACVAERNNDGETALHIAAQVGLVYVIELLLLRGADINARGYEGRTPLHCAIENGHIAAIEFLASKGSDLGAISGKRTPLQLFRYLSEPTFSDIVWAVTGTPIITYRPLIILPESSKEHFRSLLMPKHEGEMATNRTNPAAFNRTCVIS